MCQKQQCAQVQVQALERPQYYSISDVAGLASERLGRRVLSGSIRYLILSGKVSDVGRCAGKRVFTVDEADAICELMKGVKQ